MQLLYEVTIPIKSGCRSFYRVAYLPVGRHAEIFVLKTNILVILKNQIMFSTLFRTTFILSCSLLLSINNFGQSLQKNGKDTSRFGKFSISAKCGIGGFFGGGSVIAPSVALEFTIGKHFVKLRGSAVYTIEISLGGSGGETPSAKEFAVLYGLRGKWKKLLTSIGVGIGYYQYTYYSYHPPLGQGSPPPYLETIKKNGIGFPVTSSIFYQPHKFGIGIAIDGNINNMKSFAAVGLGLRYTF